MIQTVFTNGYAKTRAGRAQIVVILHALVAFQCSAGSSFRSFTRHSTTQRYASPVQTKRDITIEQCLFLCGQVKTCQSVSYEPTTRQCEINSAYPAQTFVSGISGPGWSVYYPSEYDLTTNAETWQSSTYCNPTICGISSKAIDGNRDGDFHAGSCSITDWEPIPPFWAVKLTSATYVHRVSLYFRTECCTERLKDATIMVASTRAAITTGGTLCANYPGPPTVSDRPVVITCSAPVYGQYVKIMLSGRQYLELCEVVIHPY